MIRRHLVSAAAVVTLAVGYSEVLAAAPAHASVSGISCTGWQHATYDPGATNTEQVSMVTYDDYLNIINEYSPTGSCVAIGSTASARESKTGRSPATFLQRNQHSHGVRYVQLERRPVLHDGAIRPSGDPSAPTP